MSLPWTAVVALLACLLGGCALDREASEVTEGDVRIWVLPRQDSGVSMGIGGIVEYVEEHRCFVFVLVPNDPPTGENPADYYQAVLWPRGTRIVAQDPPTLEVPGHGEVRPGDEFQGGGYISDPPPELTVPAACMTQSGTAAFVQQ